MKIARYSRPPDDTEQKLVGFLIENVRYAVDIMLVREIINPIALIHVPAMPSYVIGVSDHRNAVVPIIDIRTRFSLGSISVGRRTKWIITKTGLRDVGLQVDRITQVLRVNEGLKRDRAALGDASAASWIKEVYGDDNGLVFEVDLDTIVGSVARMTDPSMVGRNDQ